jgi:hypothetical protein
MQIAATGMGPVHSPQPTARPPEAAERAPDRDNDGDEGKTSTSPQPLPPPPPGRGGRVDMMA